MSSNTDNTVPTPPHNEPVRDDADMPLHRPSRPASQGGHWYSFPGQQPHAPSQPEVPAPPLSMRGQLRSASVRDRVRRRKVRRELGAPDDWAWVIIASALLGTTVLMSMIIFFLLQATRGIGGTMATAGPGVEPTSVLYGPGGILEGVVTSVSGDGGMLGDGQSMVIHPWDGQERFTVLMLGMDRRPGEFGGAYRTDTMILISLDPATDRVGMLSIPRDLAVEIPGYRLQKINSAYTKGELEAPGGGPLLAMQTVQYNFGIRINEFVTVDFETFVAIIDLIGGIHVEVPYDIYDPEYPDMNYGYDPFYIEAGWQTLDGATALKYARSRHGSDDIDRSRRQQQVILAVRDQVLTANKIPELAPRAFDIWAELDDGINTGLSLDQVLQLAWWAKDIPSTNYTRGVVGWEYVIPQRIDGLDYLIPDRNKLGPLMVEVFGPNYNQ
ncbi:MAG: LCP family protein [Anaerolineae bacterium]|nr:LCP family protein [Anaerolineae bacterium]